MPSINMIAVRRADKRRQEKNIRKLLYGIIGESGLIVAAAFVITARIFGMQGHVNDLADQLAKLKPKVTEIQALQAETAAMQPKVTTLDGAKADTLFWYSSLGAVTDSLPAQTWLTSMGTSNSTSAATPGAYAGTDPTLNISGIAMSQAMVGETMLRMNTAPALDHVDLAFVTQQKIGQANAVSFQMTVHLKPESGAVAPVSLKGASNAQKS